MADRLRRELNRASATYSTSSQANGAGCTTECRFVPGHKVRSQAELDQIAREMTVQVMNDLRTGKLHRDQIIANPDWYGNQVAHKLVEWDQQNQHQQSMQNHFSMQQQQHQQQHHQHSQSSQFQQQSQSQNNFGFIQPSISGGKTYHKVVEEHRKEVNNNGGYLVPTIHGSTIFHHNNCSDQMHHQNVFPFANVHNQFNQRIESDRQFHQAPTFIAPVITNGDSTYRVEQSYHRKEQRLPPQVSVVIPSQNSYTHQYQEEQHQYQRHQPRPQIYGINQHSHSSHESASSQKVHNVQIITPAPAPVITKQDIYDHFYESEVVPGYQPRVTIDKNTKFHELEVHNRQEHHYRPVVIPAVTSRSETRTEEEQRIERQYHQNPIVIPGSTNQVVEREEYEINRQVTQRPIVIPQQNVVTHTEKEEFESEQHVQRPQYPVIHQTTNVQSYNETHHTDQSHTNTQIIHRPSGHTVTTIEESHYVNILPQPANSYVIRYNDEEYKERLNSIQQELHRLGYGVFTEEEYNMTISSGGFIHNGYKYLYNPGRHCYEKSERVDITEEEYYSLLHGLQSQLQQIGMQMTESQYNQTIIDGYFVVNGVRYIYDSETGTYHRQEMSHDQYEILRQRLQAESDRYGWGLTVHEINQTIATGNLIINGHQYTFDKQTGWLVEEREVEVNEQEYRTILRRLQEQLYELGFDQMSETEYNQTIKSGFFVRNGQKWQYNADIGRYYKVELSEENYYSIIRKLKETLQRLNYRQMSDHEMNQTIATGQFIRGGYQWTYNVETGEVTAIRTAQRFEELSDIEFESITRRLQALLRSMGYPEMSQIEVETTITSGTFSRGGNYWVYRPSSGEFEHIDLSEREYSYRLEKLNQILSKLGIQKTEKEKYEIIYRGNFYHGGYRYEYDTSTGQFVQVHMSEGEYQQRKRQLLQQLLEIGYGTMTDSECRITINSGVFYYGGHEWVYNYRSSRYEMGKTTNRENGIVDDNYFTNIDKDHTHYETSANETERPPIDRPTKRPKEIISKDRGDQPPQTYVEEDYDDETPKPAPIIIPTRPPPRPIVTPVPIAVSTSAYSSRYESHSQRTQQIAYAVPQPKAEVQSYHHKKTTYSQQYVSIEFELEYGGNFVS